jgi:hypothetical protein
VELVIFLVLELQFSSKISYIFSRRSRLIYYLERRARSARRSSPEGAELEFKVINCFMLAPLLFPLYVGGGIKGGVIAHNAASHEKVISYFDRFPLYSSSATQTLIRLISVVELTKLRDGKAITLVGGAGKLKKWKLLKLSSIVNVKRLIFLIAFRQDLYRSCMKARLFIIMFKC